MIPKPRKSWGGRLLLGSGIVLYLGTGGGADLHAHHAVQFVWVANGTAEISMLRESSQVQAALIPAQVEHAFDAGGQPLALLLVEAHGARGRELNLLAQSTPGQELAPTLASLSFPSMDLSASDLETWAQDVLAVLGVKSTDSRAPSRVTRRAIEYIEQSIERVPSLEVAATYASISPSRLSHRFSEEVGIPFRRFVLWTRIKRAVVACQGGASLTQAAVKAGFSDAAHLSRTFRGLFGLSPSLVLPLVELAGDFWSDKP